MDLCWIRGSNHLHGLRYLHHVGETSEENERFAGLGSSPKEGGRRKVAAADLVGSSYRRDPFEGSEVPNRRDLSATCFQYAFGNY